MSTDDLDDDVAEAAEATDDTTRKPRKRKAKIAMRIPDDEVSRPTASGTPGDGIARAPSQPAVQEIEPIAPTRIISVGAPATAEAEAVAPLPAPTPAPVIDDAPTPIAPPVIEAIAGDRESVEVPIDEDLDSEPPPAPSPVAVARPITQPPPRPITQPPPPKIKSEPAPPLQPLELDEAEAEQALSSRTPSTRPPATAMVDVVEVPKADALPAPLPAEAKKDEPAPTSSEEIVEVEPEPISLPPPSLEEAEVEPDDLVSVESLPAAALKAKAAAEAKGPVSTPGKGRPIFVPAVSQPFSPQPLDAKRARRPWWEDLFNDDFIRTTAKITDGQVAGEVDFIEDSLGVAKGGTLLDVACGTGLHAIELSRRGYSVVGYDLSLAMLARAAEEAQERNQKINFIQGDMREMSFEDAFDGVYCWGASFGYFEEEKNHQVIVRIHKALRSGGQFLLDVTNRDYVARQSPSLCWFEGEGVICMDEMQVDWITSRMRVKRTIMMDDGARTREIEYSIRIYALHELGKMLHDHGFKIVEVSGRCATPGVFFGTESPRTLILAEKR